MVLSSYINITVGLIWLAPFILYELITKKDTSLFFSKNKRKSLEVKLPFYLWTPAEDGIFFVPVVYLGINYLTAAVFGFLFGAIHLFSYPILACVPKAISAFLIILYVIPDGGIFSVFVGHIILDAILFFAFKLFSESKIINGKKFYYFSHYYDNGTLKEEGFHHNQLREGVIKYYSTNGHLKSEAYFTNDIKNGVVKFYYQNQKLMSQVNCVNDKYEGEYNHFYQSGKIKQQGFYKEGKFFGSFKYFNEDGSLMNETNYDADGNIILQE